MDWVRVRRLDEAFLDGRPEDAPRSWAHEVLPGYLAEGLREPACLQVRESLDLLREVAPGSYELTSQFVGSSRSVGQAHSLPAGSHSRWKGITPGPVPGGMPA